MRTYHTSFRGALGQMARERVIGGTLFPVKGSWIVANFNAYTLENGEDIFCVYVLRYLGNVIFCVYTAYDTYEMKIICCVYGLA